MIIICEECGKKYRIDPDRIAGTEARYRCKGCSHVITVAKPAPPAPAEPPPAPEPPASPPEAAPAPPPPRPVEARSREEESRTAVLSTERRRGFSLRAKMMALFVAVPILLMVGSGAMYFRQLRNLSGLIAGESSRVVAELAEKIIEEKSAAVALQVRQHLLAHPETDRKQFNSDPDLKSIAVQKVGTTGYTALYELPGADGVWRTWAHANGKIIGIDMRKLEKPLGENFPGFWKVYTDVAEGPTSRGYYSWRDSDGTMRDKFMVCTRVPGTPFVIAATTYLDEFTKPVTEVRSAAERITTHTRNMLLVTLAGSLVLIAAIVVLYSVRLTGRIRSLTDVAERISVGDLDAEVDVGSKDELGDLGNAIARMQESIRLSIERLRRRRSA